jgi:exopolysaccharide production protein ExoQ
MLGLLAFPLAFVAAIALMLGIALTSHWGYKREEGLIPFASVPIVAIIIIIAVTSGRNLNDAAELVMPILVKHPLVVWGSRVTSLLVIFASGERILRQVLHPRSGPISSIWLMGAFIIFFLTNVAATALFGAHVVIAHDYLYMVLAGCAALIATKKEGDIALLVTRNALFFLLILSAVFIVVKPEMVLSRGYVGLIPGLHIRYAGLSSHANNFGPLVVVFFLCLWRIPFEWRLLNLSAWFLGAMSLILAQSKTSWIAFLVCTTCVAYFQYRDEIKRWIFDYRNPRLPAVLLMLPMMTLVAGTLVFMFTDVGDKIFGFFTTRAGGELLTFTGRSRIWVVALEEWHKHPVFGYGLTLWNEEFRQQIGMDFAVHAHNQFYQSLSVAGTVGAVGLVVYIAILFVFALKAGPSSRGLSMALFSLIILRSVSEIPLSMTGFDGDNLTHLLLLTVIAANLAKRRADSIENKSLTVFHGAT